MNHRDRSPEGHRSDGELAQMVTRVAHAVRPDVIICVTGDDAFVQHLLELREQARLVAATADHDTCRALEAAGFDALQLPLQAADMFNQVRYVFSVALRAGKVAPGELVLCAVGASVYPGKGDLVVLTDIDPAAEYMPVSSVIKLGDGVQPRVLEAAVTVAAKVGRVSRRGKGVGTIFVLGDVENVLKGARQLIPNPLAGHGKALRQITNPDIHDTLVELAKLDGAFVIRGDGFIESAAVYLSSPEAAPELLAGLGARHTAAAAVTARTEATAIVVSATDGNVRVFSEGRLVLKIDPGVPYGPTVEEVE